MFPFSAAKLLPSTFITFVHSFLLSVQNQTTTITALSVWLVLVASGYTNVHKLRKHKEIGAWRRRGLVYQPVTGKR